MKLKHNWRNNSLETLEGKSWGNSAEAPTSLVKRCIELSKIPIENFTLSDLRLMIGQQIGLAYLIPIALEKLQEDIFIEADYYPGDLLTNILSIDSSFWETNEHYWKQLDALIKNRRQELFDHKIDTLKFDSSRFNK